MVAIISPSARLLGGETPGAKLLNYPTLGCLGLTPQRQAAELSLNAAGTPGMFQAWKSWPRALASAPKAADAVGGVGGHSLPHHLSTLFESECTSMNMSVQEQLAPFSGRVLFV